MSRHHCPRCDETTNRPQRYCSGRCRAADEAERPERMAAVLIDRAEQHERLAHDLDQQGKAAGAAAVRRTAHEWRTRAADLDPTKGRQDA